MLTPLDLTEDTPPNPWAKAAKDAQTSTQQVMGVGAPGAAPGAPPSAPALVEQPKVAKLTPSTSTAQPSPIDGSPLDLQSLGAEQRAKNVSPAPAYGQHDLDTSPAMAPIVSGAPKTAEDLKPAPSAFHSFLSTMRDVATGRKSDPDSVAGQVRGGFGHLSNTLRDMSIAVGGPELLQRGKEAEANRALARAQMESLNQYRQGTLGVQKQKAETAEEKASQTEPITVQEGDVYHTQLGVKPGTKLRPQDIASLLKNKESLESKESEGELNRAAQLERTGLTTRFKTTPAGLYDTKTNQMIAGTGAGIPATPEIIEDYGLPADTPLGTIIKPMELARLRMAQVAAAPKQTVAERPMIDVEGKLIKPTAVSTTTPQLPPKRGTTAPAGPPAPFNPQAGAPGATAPAAPAPPRAGVGHPMKAPPMMFATQNGHQVAGTPSELMSAGIKNFAPLPSNQVGTANVARMLTDKKQGLISQIEQSLNEFKPEELSAIDARWQEFKAGTIGVGDPRYMRLRTYSNLLNSAAMQAHVGASGSDEMMAHFKNLQDAGMMNASAIKAALGAEKQYFNERAMRPMMQARDPQGNMHEAPVGTKLPKNWKPVNE